MRVKQPQMQGQGTYHFSHPNLTISRTSGSKVVDRMLCYNPRVILHAQDRDVQYQ